jgi:PAS domain S-box-containing protein
MSIDSAVSYKALIEHSSDIITVLNEEGIFRYVSPSVSTILGYVPEELVGNNAFDYIHPEDRGEAIQTFESIIDSPGQETDPVEHRFKNASGSWVWLESATSNRTDSNLDGFVITARDITDRKVSERELAAERDKYSTVVEQSYDGIAILQDTTIKYANQRCHEILGYDDGELVGTSFLDTVAMKDRKLVRGRYDRRLDPDADTPPPRYEANMITKSGEKRAVEASAAEIEYEGEPADLVTLRDVTERKALNERLENRTRELEALNRVVRHDIRNDMNVVLGWAQMLEDHVDAEGEDYLRRILETGNHIVELTRIAKEYVDTLSNEADLKLEPIPIRSTLENEITLRQESHPQAEFIPPDEIPEVEVKANQLLGSVFRNLLNNAVQHNDREEPVVEITCQTRDNDVLITIADNGPGVPDSEKESIFGKGMKNLDSPGTGIGLYLVQTLIDQYDGRVWIEDNDPRGAVFKITLPIVTQ